MFRYMQIPFAKKIPGTSRVPESSQHFANILDSAHFANGTLKPGLQGLNPSCWQPSLAKSNRSKAQHSTTCRQRHGLECDVTKAMMRDMAKKKGEKLPTGWKKT